MLSVSAEWLPDHLHFLWILVRTRPFQFNNMHVYIICTLASAVTDGDVCHLGSLNLHVVWVRDGLVLQRLQRIRLCTPLPWLRMMRIWSEMQDADAMQWNETQQRRWYICMQGGGGYISIILCRNKGINLPLHFVFILNHSVAMEFTFSKFIWCHCKCK